MKPATSCLVSILFTFVCLFPSSHSFAEDQWFCREGASRLLGEVMESCGIGKSADEAEARKKALDGAFEEFDRICRESANCRDYEKTVEPMRTECIKGKDEAFTCYRALDFTVTHQKKEKSFDDKDKKDAIVSAIAANTDANGTTTGVASGENPNASSNDANKAINNDVNPGVASMSTPAENQSSPTYRSARYYTVANPYIYVIGSQPQVVYVRSQLPPQYVPAPPVNNPPPPAKRMNAHPHHPNHPRKNSQSKNKWEKHHQRWK